MTRFKKEPDRSGVGYNADEVSFTMKERTVKKHFDEHTKDWIDIYERSTLNSHTIQMRLRYVLKYVDNLNLKGRTTILDLGCGTGPFTMELLKRGHRVMATDISLNMIQTARQRCLEAHVEANAAFGVQDAQDLPFREGMFDLVLAVGLVEYLQYDRWALREIFRVLKPEGHLIVTVPNKVRLTTLKKILISRVAHAMKESVKTLLPSSVWSFLKKNLKGSLPKSPIESIQSVRKLYDLDPFDRTLQEIGFRLVDSVSHGHGPFAIFGFGLFSEPMAIKVSWLLQSISEKNVPWLHRLGNNYNALWQKRDKSKESSARFIFKDMEKTMKTFESAHNRLFGRLRNSAKNYPQTMRSVASFDEKLTGLSSENSHVLILVPHPDDEIIGCGGSLTKMVNGHLKVRLLYLTDGRNLSSIMGLPRDQRKAIRIEEAKQVGKLLGPVRQDFWHNANFWGEPKHYFESSEENINSLSNVLNEFRPKAIFLPFFDEMHPDHVMTNEILRLSLEKSFLKNDQILIFGYEVSTFVPPNCYSNITLQFDKKEKLLLLYRVGMKPFDYISYSEQLNAYHSVQGLGVKGFAEAFFVLNAGEYMELFQKRKVAGLDFGPYAKFLDERWLQSLGF